MAGRPSTGASAGYFVASPQPSPSLRFWRGSKKTTEMLDSTRVGLVCSSFYKGLTSLGSIGRKVGAEAIAWCLATFFFLDRGCGFCGVFVVFHYKSHFKWDDKADLRDLLVRWAILTATLMRGWNLCARNRG